MGPGPGGQLLRCLAIAGGVDVRAFYFVSLHFTSFLRMHARPRISSAPINLVQASSLL